MGDFGKYGLLKALCLSGKTDNGPTLSLGVIWYLTSDEAHNDDGKHTGYLKLTSPKREFYRECDHMLYDSLRDIVHLRRSRDIREIRKQGVLPSNTIFYEEFLSFCDIPPYQKSSQEKRLAHRERWVEGALDATLNSDIVFFDPDNGLEVSMERHRKYGVKYTFFDELSPFLDRGQSLVIYQHINRHKLGETAEDQIRDRLRQIKERLNPRAEPFALLFHRGSARAFFIIPSERHQTLLRERAKHFSNGLWSRHFDLVDPITPTA